MYHVLVEQRIPWRDAMRISCVALGCVRDDQGRYLLFRDMRRAEGSGVHTLRPFVVPLEATRTGTDYLIRHVGARTFEERNALRFYIRDDNILSAMAWFRSRRMRKDPDIVQQVQNRLIRLGLVERKRDMKGAQAAWRGVADPHVACSTRERVTDRGTTYLADVWDVTVPPGVLGLLAYKAGLHHGPVYFATTDEVRNGIAGITHVSSLSQALLTPVHRA
jgi:hypothetical protein